MYTERDHQGNLIRTEDVDLTTGQRTVTVHVENGTALPQPRVTAEAVPADQLAELRAADKEERQLADLDTKYGEIKGGIDELRAYTRITVSDYRFDTVLSTEVDAREAARQINSLRQAVLDQAVAIRVLTRLVRNIAAADD